MANNFFCKPIIDEASGDFPAAAWALIHVAWVCDDVEKARPARTCRAKTADMIRKTISNGQQAAKQDGAETSIQVDLLRRAGRVAEARRVIAERRCIISEDIILKILYFLDGILPEGDDGCQPIAERIGENP